MFGHAHIIIRGVHIRFVDFKSLITADRLIHLQVTVKGFDRLIQTLLLSKVHLSHFIRLKVEIFSLNDHSLRNYRAIDALDGIVR